MTSKKASQTRTVRLARHTIGGPDFCVIAGPCSVESEEQFLKTAEAVREAGACFLRGGIFKLRSHPDSFQGLGSDAYEMVRSVRESTGMAFFSEITDPRQISDLMDVVDAFQVGARNMHNYALLKELGQVGKPVLLKRNFSALIKEWIHAADYIVKAGNEDVILCERGIRTFETSTRNTFDLNAVAYVKAHSSYPVIADPSHGTGAAALVTPMALAAAAAGADGLMIEVHPAPSEALSDGFQSLNFSQFGQLMKSLRKVLDAVGRPLAEERD
jgi:3-deoxy-7-phosphoheptulonate synthase